MSDSRSQFAAAQFLHMLKETCALHCLMALYALGPLPVSQRAVMDLTGFDDEAVHKGLNKLLILGLAVCAGEDYRSGWQLGPAANAVPLPLHLLGATAPGPIPVLPESDSLKEEEKEKEESIIHSNLLDSSSDDLTTSVAPNQAAPAAAPHSAAVVVLPAKSRQRASPLLPRIPPPAPLPNGRLPDDPTLRRAFYLVFEASDIYLQFRRPLADALLAEDGPAWLHQALGWLCHARRHLPHVQAGAVVYISLRDRLPCDSAYLPPPDLPFAAALAWALRGGEPEEIDEPADLDSDETLAGSDAAAVCETPEDQLWRALLERLSGELPRATLDGQLRPARLAAFDDHCCLIAAPTPQSRDWLNARLRTVLAQALGELTHKTMTVEIIVE